MFRLASAFMVAALAASSAWAQAYLGLSVGQAKFSNACSGAPSGVTCDKNDTSFKLLGGYQITRSLAVEAGYSQLGTVGANTGEHAELSAFDLCAVGSWQTGNRFALLGRLGAYRGKTSSTMPSASAVPVPFGAPQPPPPPQLWASGSNTDVTYGLGASYDLTDGMFRLEWQRFRGLDGGGSKFDVDVVSIGGIFRF